MTTAFLDRSVAAVHGLFGAAACSCALVSDDGSSLRFVAAHGQGAAEIVGVTIPVGRGIAGWAAMSGQSIVVQDVATDARFARDVAESTRYVPSTILAAPMFDLEGETTGVVSVLDPRVDHGSEWTLAVLGTLAVQLGLLVEAGAVPPGSGTAGDARMEELGRRVVALTEELRG